MDSLIETDLDLTEKGVDLAELIFDIADECDTSQINYGSIDLSGALDEMLIRFDILSFRHKNPHLSEEELQKHVDEITAEHEQNKAKIAAEKAAKREKVKKYIKGNASEGYQLAYKICKEDGSDKAKKLAYQMIHRLKNIPTEEKIEICCQYAEMLINNGKSGNEIAKIYCQMAGLFYPVSKRMDYTACLSFYEKAYEYIDKPTRMLNEIIGFCNIFQIDELRLKCQQKKEDFHSIKE